LEYLKANAAANGYEIVEYADFPSESDSLLTGQVDAAVQDLPVFNQFVKDNEGKVKVAAQFNTGEQYGIGMKLGNTALKNLSTAPSPRQRPTAPTTRSTPSGSAAPRRPAVAAAPHRRVTDLSRPVAGHRARPSAVFA
jgi:hypothetical protein